MKYSKELLNRFENKGVIYILINPSFQDAIIKIGKTGRLSEKRAKELSAATGVPTAFRVLMDEVVLDMDLAEKLIHKKLNSQRINPKREYFRMPLKDAVRTVYEICRDVDEKLINESQTRLVIFGVVSAESLKKVLQKHVGGSALVSIIYASADGNARCEMTLGDAWKVFYSSHLVSDFKKVNGVADLILVPSTADMKNHVNDDFYKDGIPF